MLIKTISYSVVNVQELGFTLCEPTEVIEFQLWAGDRETQQS